MSVAGALPGARPPCLRRATHSARGHPALPLVRPQQRVPRDAAVCAAAGGGDGESSVRGALETLFASSASYVASSEDVDEDAAEWVPNDPSAVVDVTLTAALTDASKNRLKQLPLMTPQWVRFPGVGELLHLWEPCVVHMVEQIIAGPKPWLFGHFVQERATLSTHESSDDDEPSASASASHADVDARANDAACPGSGDAGMGPDKGEAVWCETGVLVEIVDIHRFSDGRLMVNTNAVCRLRSLQPLQQVPYQVAQTELLPDSEEATVRLAALGRRGEAPSMGHADFVLSQQSQRLQALECKVWSMYNNTRHMAGILRLDKTAPKIPAALQAVMPAMWNSAADTEGVCDLSTCTVDDTEHVPVNALRFLDMLQRLQILTYRLALELDGIERKAGRQMFLENRSIEGRLEALHDALVERQRFLAARIAVAHAVSEVDWD